MSTAHGDAPPPSPRTDLIIAAVFFAFGAGVVAASIAMPTFTDQGTPIYVAPGLVPGFHGIVIGILSILLAARSLSRGALRPAAGDSLPASRQSLVRIALATVLAVAFAAGLVSRVPFWLAAALFVFCFINVFEYERALPLRVMSKNAGIALAIGLVTGIGISELFERVFLIRMP
jgi:hypothetical protein